MAWRRRAILPAALALSVAVAAAAETQEFKFNAAPNSTVTINNGVGSVRVSASRGTQVTVRATRHSDQVEIDTQQADSRVDVRTHYLADGLSAEQKTVEYVVQLPRNLHVTVHSNSGPVVIEQVGGDVTVESERGPVEVRSVSNAHVHVRNIDGTTTLVDIREGHVEIDSVSGDVHLESVSGPQVSVSTNGGHISYDGDFGNGGRYQLTTNSGNIDVLLPAKASLEILAHSVRGKVENAFPFRQKSHSPSASTRGSAFAGTSNGGSSAVELRSLSGTIRVKQK